MPTASGHRLPMRSDRNALWRQVLALMAIAASVFVWACGTTWPTAPRSDLASAPPPVHESEGVIAFETSLGRAVAELVADPDQIDPTDRVVLRVESW
jgi:hypothetical protein